MAEEASCREGRGEVEEGELGPGPGEELGPVDQRAVFVSLSSLLCFL